MVENHREFFLEILSQQGKGITDSLLQKATQGNNNHTYCRLTTADYHGQKLLVVVFAEVMSNARFLISQRAASFL